MKTKQNKNIRGPSTKPLGTPLVEMNNVDDAAVLSKRVWQLSVGDTGPLMRGGQSVQETFRWNPRGEKFEESFV